MDNYYHKGWNRGQASGSLVFDGNTKTEAYRWVREGYDEGTPEVMDLCPSPLAGLWADESIPEVFGLAVGAEWPDDESLDEYERGFVDGFWDEVLRVCAYQLDDTERV